MWAFDPAVRSVPVRSAAARQLLTAAGWRMPAATASLARTAARSNFCSLPITHRLPIVRKACSCKRRCSASALQLVVKYYPLDILYAPQGMGGIQHGGKFDLLALRLVLRHRSRRFVATHVRQLSAARLQRSALLQRWQWMPRRPARSRITIFRRAKRHMRRSSAYYRVDNPTLYLLVAAPARGDQRRFPRLQSQPRHRIVERLAVEHLVSERNAATAANALDAAFGALRPCFRLCR